MIKLGIIGAGGLANEVASTIDEINLRANKMVYEYTFFVDDAYMEFYPHALPISKFIAKEYFAVVAVDDTHLRKYFVNKLPKSTRFETIIHPTAVIGNNVKLGKGSIVQQFASITAESTIGKHCILNIYSYIAHDCVVGDFVTLSPQSGINGNCIIGDHVYCGANSNIREATIIKDNITIGLNAGVIKDLLKEGTYLGTPAEIYYRPRYVTDYEDFLNKLESGEIDIEDDRGDYFEEDEEDLET